MPVYLFPPTIVFLDWELSFVSVGRFFWLFFLSMGSNRGKDPLCSISTPKPEDQVLSLLHFLGRDHLPSYVFFVLMFDF